MPGYVYRGSRPWKPKAARPLALLDGRKCPDCGYRRTRRSQHIVLCGIRGKFRLS
jgi:hypothetical protein